MPAEIQGTEVVKMLAAALTNLDIVTAEGKHYLSPQDSPFVAGNEGVARLPNGERRYFPAGTLVQPYGSLGEYALGYAGRSLPVPEEVPDGLAAALGNAGLAGWLPLSWRAAMQKGETVLVLGATGTTGLISVAAARLLGAGRVVAAGRNPAALQTTLSVGADATLNLQADDLNHRLVAEAGNGFDIVIDYLNGPATQAAMHAMATGGRLVQIGSALGSEISVPAQLARKLSLSVLGFAYYHAPLALQAEAYLAVCAAAIAGGIPIDYREMPLNEVMAAWALQKGGDSCRKVMIPGPASPVLIPGNQ